MASQGEASVTTANEGARADTFPKLMRHHARVRAGRPAIRHKDRGIWQTWGWAEAYENVRALAQGFRDLGLGESEKIAVVGANRPVSYWSITAAQLLPAVPVPVYADAIADEIELCARKRRREIVDRSGPGTGRQGSPGRRQADQSHPYPF